MTDVRLYRDGSMLGLLPLTRAGRDWIDDCLDSEVWQWLGNALWIDVRFGPAIVDAMQRDGLAVVEG
jgi:hypothetical protein